MAKPEVGAMVFAGQFVHVPAPADELRPASHDTQIWAVTALEYRPAAMRMIEKEGKAGFNEIRVMIGHRPTKQSGVSKVEAERIAMSMIESYSILLALHSA